MIGIYKIENLINGKIYIGQSVNIEKRWKAHRTRPFQDTKESNSLLYKAIKEYGLDSFLFEVLEECSKEELNQKEQYWIEYYNSNNKEMGYNATKGGGSTPTAIKLSDEQILEIYQLLKNTQITQTEIAKKYNINQSYISYINQGTYRAQIGWIFPIRPLYFEQQLRHQQTSICPFCGGDKSHLAKMCSKCSSLKNRKVERPNRQELKQLIRNIPFTQIGKKYGVSDNAIRKWCDAYNLPRKSTEIKKYTDEEWENI